MKKYYKLLVLPIIILSLAGCGKTIPVLENGEEAIITLKEKNVSTSEFYELLKEKYGKYVIVDFIDKIILDSKYETTDEETKYINTQVDAVKKYASENSYTVEYVLAYQYGLESVEDYKDMLSLNYRRSIAVKDYLAKDITDKQIETYYKNNIYGDIEVKHILISPESDDKKDDALKEAKDIIKKLKDGEDFSALAKKYSDDTNSAKEGGDLGFISTGEMLEEFENAAFKLKKGEYTTTPVETTYGYHIILKTDEKDKPKQKDVKEDIITELVTEKINSDAKLYYETLEDIRKENELVIVDSEVKKQYDEYIKSLKTNINHN